MLAKLFPFVQMQSLLSVQRANKDQWFAALPGLQINSVRLTIYVKMIFDFIFIVI